MRTAFNSDFLTNAEGTKVGIFTGADFCAEHEWGIKELRAALHMNDEAIGVAKRTNRRIEASHLDIYKPKKGEAMAYLWVGQDVDPLYRWSKEPFPTAKDLWVKKNATNKAGDLYCEWDADSFRVLVKGLDNVLLLEKLYRAIQDKKCYIELGGRAVFNNGGLAIINVDDMTEEQKQQVEGADLDRKRLLLASAATGIEAKLKATQKDSPRGEWPEAGCRWFALSPRWANETEKKKTQHPVVYWLNPYSQHAINSGWFTVEDLEQWAQGKGPCIRTDKKA